MVALVRVPVPDSEWRQAGDIHGALFPLWWRYLDGVYLTVHRGDETGKWYKAVNCSFRGSTPDFERAKRACELEARGEGSAW